MSDSEVTFADLARLLFFIHLEKAVFCEVLLDDVSKAVTRKSREHIAAFRAHIEHNIKRILKDTQFLFQKSRLNVLDHSDTALNLLRGYSRVEEFHFDLKYLGKDVQVPPELYAFCRSLAHEANLQKNAELTILPEEKYGYYSFRTYEYLKNRYLSAGGKAAKSVLLMCPYVECNNPFSWILLLHEFGHSVDSCVTASDSVFERALKIKVKTIESMKLAKSSPARQKRSWTQELFSDVMALQVVGPVYFCALVEFFVFTTPLGQDDQPLGAHPSSRCRINILYDCLMNDALVESDEELKNIIAYYYRIAAERWLISAKLKPNPRGLPGKSGDAGELLSWFGCRKGKMPRDLQYCREIRGSILSVIQKLSIRRFKRQNWNQSKRLREGLRAGIPIGARRRYLPAETIQRTIREIECETNPKTRADIAYRLLDRTRDMPSNVVEIANATALFRHTEYFPLLRTMLGEGDVIESFVSYKKYIQNHATTLRDSIAMNEIHQTVRSWKHDP